MADKSENSNDHEQVSEIRQMPNLWIRKMLTIVDAWDLDKDGCVGYADAMKIVDKFIKVGKSSDNLIACYRDAFKHTSDNPDAGAATATSMPKQLMEVWRTKDNPVIGNRIHGMYSDMFKTIDFNATGFLTFDQYLVFWNVFNLDKRFAKMQFDYMDTDHDGKISEEEFVNGFLDYRANPEDTLNRFYGPLINY